MTNVFLTEPYLREISTKVEEVRIVKKKSAISLERNIFYPGGGGQLPDKGTISFNNSTPICISRIIKMGGVVILCLPEKKDISVGESVHAKVDWSRRYKYMQCHTSAHIVMGAISKKVNNYIPSGIEISENGDIVTVRFNADWSGNIKDAEHFIKMANEIINQNTDVTIKEFATLEKAISEHACIYRGPKDLTGKVRIVIIKDWDANPCGGTHVRNLSEIGKVNLVNCNNQEVIFTLR